MGSRSAAHTYRLLSPPSHITRQYHTSLHAIPVPPPILILQTVDLSRPVLVMSKYSNKPYTAEERFAAVSEYGDKIIYSDRYSSESRILLKTQAVLSHEHGRDELLRCSVRVCKGCSRMSESHSVVVAIECVSGADCE